MASRKTTIIVALLGLIGCAGPAAADSITVVNDLRAVTVLAAVADSGPNRGSQGPGDALSTTASASAGTMFANAVARLTSSIADPAHLSGSGSALASFFSDGPATASAASVFAVDFVLDAPHIYSFNGTFNLSDFPVRPTGAFNEARWTAALSSGDTFLFNLGNTQTPFPPPTISGNLTPGSYHFLVKTTADGSTDRPATVVEDTQFQFAFDLAPAPVDPTPAPTPEPTSILLVVTGIASVVAGKTRTRGKGVRRIGEAQS